MTKSISELDDKQLTNLIKNYEAKGVTSGGPFPLSEVKLELLRRTPSNLDTIEVAQRIIELAAEAADGLITYGQLWQEFHPDQQWRGNADQQIIGNALARVVAFCVKENLPILTTLVVQKGTRKLSDLAIENIFQEAKALGVDTGNDPKAFVDGQRRKALQLRTSPKGSN